MCHHNNILWLEEISLRQAIRQGRYQELRYVLLLSVQVTRLQYKQVSQEYNAEDFQKTKNADDLSFRKSFQMCP